MAPPRRSAPLAARAVAAATAVAVAAAAAAAVAAGVPAGPEAGVVMASSSRAAPVYPPPAPRGRLIGARPVNGSEAGWSAAPFLVKIFTAVGDGYYCGGACHLGGGGEVNWGGVGREYAVAAPFQGGGVRSKGESLAYALPLPAVAKTIGLR